jgi:hypothetical protein
LFPFFSIWHPSRRFLVSRLSPLVSFYSCSLPFYADSFNSSQKIYQLRVSYITKCRANSCPPVPQASPDNRPRFDRASKDFSSFPFLIISHITHSSSRETKVSTWSHYRRQWEPQRDVI